MESDMPGYTTQRKAIETFMKLCEFGGLGPMCPKCEKYPDVLIFDGTSLRNMHTQKEVKEKKIAAFVQPQLGWVSMDSFKLYHYIKLHEHRKVLLKYLRTDNELRKAFPLQQLRVLPEAVWNIICLFHKEMHPAVSDAAPNNFTALFHQHVPGSQQEYDEVRQCITWSLECL